MRRNAKRDQVLKAVMNDNYRRALMAFPDEDVLVGTRFATVDGFEAFKVLTDINPRPDHKSSGEERAWGRRLAKRFGLEAGYDDKAFVAKGNGSFPLVFDHESLKPEKLDPAVAAFFRRSSPSRATAWWRSADHGRRAAEVQLIVEATARHGRFAPC